MGPLIFGLRCRLSFSVPTPVFWQSRTWPGRPRPHQKDSDLNILSPFWFLSTPLTPQQVPRIKSGPKLSQLAHPPGVVAQKATGGESRLCSLPGQSGRVRPKTAWAWCSEAQRPAFQGTGSGPANVDSGYVVVAEVERGCGQAQSEGQSCRPHRLFVSQDPGFRVPRYPLPKPLRRCRTISPPEFPSQHPPAAFRA